MRGHGGEGIGRPTQLGTSDEHVRIHRHRVESLLQPVAFLSRRYGLHQVTQIPLPTRRS
jgi:hypothetical protein